MAVSTGTTTRVIPKGRMETEEDPTEDLSPCRGSEPVPETVSAWVASFEDDKASGRPGWGS